LSAVDGSFRFVVFQTFGFVDPRKLDGALAQTDKNPLNRDDNQTKSGASANFATLAAVRFARILPLRFRHVVPDFLL
jgi:hypothetical protein